MFSVVSSLVVLYCRCTVNFSASKHSRLIAGSGFILFYFLTQSCPGGTLGAERWIKGVVFSAELPLTSLPSILPLFISCFLLSFDPLTLPEDSSCCWRRERGRKGRRWWWKRLRMPGLSELPPSCCHSHASP